MPLLTDASSPATHITSTGDNTCAAFTPPDASLLFLMWAANTISADPASPTILSSPSRTWTLNSWDHLGSGSPSAQGQTAIFSSIVTTTPGSMDATVHNYASGGDQSSFLMLYVLTGADPTAPIGVVHGGRQLSGTSLSDSYTASITGGQGFMVICDWSGASTAAWAAATGCEIVSVGTITGILSYAVIRRTYPDGVLSTSTTLGLTGLTSGGEYHWSMAEVISAEAAELAREPDVPSAGVLMM